MFDLSPAERRNRTMVIVAGGLIALGLLAVWTIILRKGPIEDDLTARTAAALDAAGIDSAGLVFEGRDGRLTIGAPLAASAELIIRAVEGVRVIEVTPVAPPTTTTTTTTTTIPPTTITTTTTTSAPPEAAFTLTSDAGGITLSGRLTPSAAAAVAEAAAGVFGAERVTDAILADPATSGPAWASRLPDALAALAYVADPGIAIDGATITLAGDIASEQRRLTLLAAFAPLGLEVADGLSIAAPPDQGAAAALELALNSALGDSSILFDTGSFVISSEGGAKLDAIAALLIEVPGARVEIGGHTDSEGPADGNLLLSRARADAVAAYLIAQGVDPVQVTAVGYGEDQPIADNSTPEGRAANRRIAFIVEGST
ncbi:MAG: OmpA family protein [Actinomycetota bacterium]